MSMNVSLPPELEARVRQRVESDKLDSLRQDIAKGLSEVRCEHTREIDFENLKQQARLLLQNRKAAA